MNYEDLVDKISQPEKNGLWSYTEKISVALATGDLSRSPERFREAGDQEVLKQAQAWDELDASQQEAVNRYRRGRGLEQIPYTAPETGDMEAERLFQKARDIISGLWNLKGLTDEERLHYLKAIRSVVDVYYLRGKSGEGTSPKNHV